MNTKKKKIIKYSLAIGFPIIIGFFGVFTLVIFLYYHSISGLSETSRKWAIISIAMLTIMVITGVSARLIQLFSEIKKSIQKRRLLSQDRTQIKKKIDIFSIFIAIGAISTLIVAFWLVIFFVILSFLCPKNYRSFFLLFYSFLIIFVIFMIFFGIGILRIFTKAEPKRIRKKPLKIHLEEMKKKLFSNETLLWNEKIKIFRIKIFIITLICFSLVFSGSFSIYLVLISYFWISILMAITLSIAVLLMGSVLIRLKTSIFYPRWAALTNKRIIIATYGGLNGILTIKYRKDINIVRENYIMWIDLKGLFKYEIIQTKKRFVLKFYIETSQKAIFKIEFYNANDHTSLAKILSEIIPFKYSSSRSNKKEVYEK